MTNAMLIPTLVIGAGAWGSALAIAMARNGHQVLLWGRNEDHLKAMQQSHSNERYLPNVPFPASLEVVTDLEQAVQRAKHVLVSVPSVAFACMLETIEPMLKAGTPLSWATKGLTPETGRFLYDTAADILGDNHPLAVI